MSFLPDYSSKGRNLHDGLWSAFPVYHDQHHYYQQNTSFDYNYYSRDHNYNHDPNQMPGGTRSHINYHEASRVYKEHNFDCSYHDSRNSPCYKRRKISDSSLDKSAKYCYLPTIYGATANYSNIPASARPSASGQAYMSGKRGRSELENINDAIFMSKEEIESCSLSRKDGIDAVHEKGLRYSYCAFIQNLGMRLELPQTTIGTAMVLCHRFFVRRSHASHDRFLIATASLFLTAKSEETGRPLNNVLSSSCEIIYRLDVSSLTRLFPIGWFEQYRERVLEAEQLILTTLNFELEVEHPFDPLTSILDKVGLSQSMLVNLALSLISEGFFFRLRSSLWLQFKPQHIAAGAVYLAAKMLSMDHSSCQNIWREFQAPQNVLHDVAEQLKELF